MTKKFVLLLFLVVQPQVRPLPTQEPTEKRITTETRQPQDKNTTPQQVPSQAPTLRRTLDTKPPLLKFNPQARKTVNSRINEFPLEEIFLRGKFANEANKFIKKNIYIGKPLESQYESVREADLDYLEEKLSKEYQELTKFFKR